MSVGWALVQYAALPLVAMVVARVVCEAGMFIYSSPFRINESIFEMAGTERVGAANITLLTMTSWAQIRSTATMNLAAVMQSLKLGSEARAPRAQVLMVAMAAVVVAILCAHVTSIYVIYTWSVPKLGWWPSASSLGTTTRLASVSAHAHGDGACGLDRPEPGGALTWGLVGAPRFVWWPLHPLGMWPGWVGRSTLLDVDLHRMAVSFTVVRFGGYRAFTRLRPLAFGLILGVSVVLTAWIVAYYFYPAPSIVTE